MTCEYIKNELNNGAVLIDVREKHEYSNGALPSSINIPLSTLSMLVPTLKDYGKVLFYCRSGARSQSATLLSISHGVNAENIGGIATNLGKCVVDKV